MSNFVKIRDGLIEDTEKICFIEPFDDGYRINFEGGSSICITIKEHNLLLNSFKARVYAVVFEEREHFKIGSEFFDKDMIISTWSSHDKAIEARDELRKYYQGDKEQIRVSIQHVDGR